MLALFGSLAPLELGLVLVAAIMIFGRDLPRVAAQLFAQLAKVRRGMRDMWRETGMEEEMRRVRNEIDDVKMNLPSPEALDPRAKARELVRDIDADVREFPSRKTEDADAAEGQDAELPPTPEELQRQAEQAEAEASRRAAEAQERMRAKMRAKRDRPAEPEGEAERRA